MKKIFNLFIFLIGFSFYTYSYAEKNLEQDKYPSSAIWKIEMEKIRGTGFFISPNLFVTNFHVVDDVIDSFDLKRTRLSQETHSRVLGIKRVYALSALDDLAILEVKESVTSWLDIADNTPKSYNKLFAIGYPDGQWAKIRKTGIISYVDEHISFPVNHTYLSGASGSPVLNQKNQIVGILSLASRYKVFAIKVKRLKKLISKRSRNTKQAYESMKKKAIQKIKTLAKKEPFAQYNLALMYYDGRGGVEQNSEQSIYWFQKAAEQGLVVAQNKLASMYYNGIGVEQNFDKAFYWYQKAAKQKFTVAQYQLAEMYHKGIGVKKNREKAKELYKKLANQGHMKAQFRLKTILFKETIKQNLKKTIQSCKNIFLPK